MRIAPPFAGIVFVVGPPVAVHATDFGIGLRLRNAVLGNTAPPRIVGIRAAEDAHEAGIVAQHEIGTAAHDDAGALCSQLLHDAALGHEEHVVGRKVAVHAGAVALGEDALEPERGNGLLVAADVRLVHVARLRGQVDELAVVEGNAERAGEHLAEAVSTAAELAGDGDHQAAGIVGVLVRLLVRLLPAESDPAVETPVEGADEVDDRPYGQRRDHGALAHAADARQRPERKQAGQRHQRQVEPELHVAEFAVKPPRDDPHEVLAGRHGDIDLDLQRDADGQHDAPDKQAGDLPGVVSGIEPTERGHRPVDEAAEAERDGNLEQEDAQVLLQLGARHQGELQHDEQQVHDDGPLAHGHRGEHAQHVGNARDGRRAEQGLRDQGDAERIDEQRDDEEQVASDEVVFHATKQNESCKIRLFLPFPR